MDTNLFYNIPETPKGLSASNIIARFENTSNRLKEMSGDELD